MKKQFIVLLTIVMILSLAACGSAPTPAETPAGTPEAPAEAAPEVPETAGPEIREINLIVPAFSILVNGVEITNEDLAGYAVYEIQTTTVNSAGTESATAYAGFALSDVFEAAGVAGHGSVTATADDGYAVEVSAEMAAEPSTLVAVTRDGVPFSAFPWFAPCSSGTTGDYLKAMVSITLDGAATQLPGADGPKDEREAEDGPPEILDRTDKVTFADFRFLVNGAEVTNAALEGLRIYKIDAVTVNSAGERSTAAYTGYRLSDVLEACGITGYTGVKAVAGDGYETELDPDSANSEYTLVAIEKDKETGGNGTIWVAPCLETSSKAYCKLVVEIIAG